MSLSSSISDVILEVVVGGLSRLFMTGANGDTGLARQAALAMLGDYDAQTRPELFLAAETIAFSLQTLEVLGQSMAADMPLNKVMRLRGSAVSLNREAHRNRQKLEQLQRSRWANEAQQAAHTLYPVEASAAQAPATDGLAAGGLAPNEDLPDGDLPAGDLPAGDLPERVLPEGVLPAGVLPAGVLPEGVLPAGVTPAAVTSVKVAPAMIAAGVAGLNAVTGDAPGADAVEADDGTAGAAAADAPAEGPVEAATSTMTHPPSIQAALIQTPGQAQPAVRTNAYRGQDCSQAHRKRLLAQQIVQNGKNAALLADATGTARRLSVAAR